ncbi:hypothetical protein ACWYXO_06065 [Janthinobacterium aestuarii]
MIEQSPLRRAFFLPQRLAAQGLKASHWAQCPERETMPFKFNADGSIATTGEGSGKRPIYIYPDGREAAFDADAAVAAIGRLNREAQGQREAKEAAQRRLRAVGASVPA